MRGLDAWLTREPDYPEEGPQRRCEACGGFLADQADSSEPWEDTEPCDGHTTITTQVYTSLDRYILDIIGWEHLGDSHVIEYDPLCGMPAPHLPHDMVVTSGVNEYRTCAKCKTMNKEVVI